MKFVIENVIAGLDYPDEGALEIIKEATTVRLVAKYSTRDQSTAWLTRKQALQLAGALQLAAWSLDDPLDD